MRITTLFVATIAIAAVPGIGLAEFNYTSAEFSYVDVEIDVGPADVDGDGFSLGGTFTVADSFYVGGSWDDYDLDFNVDGEMLRIGGGYFHTLDEDLDFVATFGFVDTELSYGDSSADDDGLSIGGGVRARLSDVIEVDALLEYVNMDKGDSDTSIDLRGRYYFSEEFAVQVKLGLGGDFETIAIGIRGEF